MKKGNLFIIVASLIILGVSFIGSKGELVENIELPIGIGADIENLSVEPEYSIPLLVSSSEDNGKSTYVIEGKADSIGETREERQVKSGKKFMLGLTRVFVYSEDAAKFGLRNFIDINLSNPELNDRCINVVCKGKAREVFDHKSPGHPNSAEFIEEMVKNLKQFNFFPMQYTMTDIIVRVDAEGRNLLLPYVELKGKEIETTGLAIFKGDKMVTNTNIEEAKTINLLKEDNVRGILTLHEDNEKYINFHAKSKRKIKCYKDDDNKYKFIIDLKITGTVINNQLYKNLSTEGKVLKQFENDMKEYVETKSTESINKIIKKYQVDVLDLGRVAAAKYGRGTGTDWNEIVSNSEIIVSAKVKVDTTGRGTY